ncbi:unnamed protein product [Symbiodinium microadriaticum]|nr:unnamed protein product [Symbiodinium microadriaticum]
MCGDVRCVQGTCCDVGHGAVVTALLYRMNWGLPTLFIQASGVGTLLAQTAFTGANQQSRHAAGCRVLRSVHASPVRIVCPKMLLLELSCAGSWLVPGMSREVAKPESAQQKPMREGITCKASAGVHCTASTDSRAISNWILKPCAAAMPSTQAPKIREGLNIMRHLPVEIAANCKVSRRPSF